MRLIINADDLGIDRSRNRGIFQCADKSALKSVSLIVAQAGWRDAVAGLKKRPQIGAGLHFNLTAGKPLARKIKSLVNKKGEFFDKFELLRRAISKLIDPLEVIGELKAQLEMMRDCGIVPTHVDGHNHVHLLPGVRQGFAQVIKKGMWVRLPHPQNPNFLDPADQDPHVVYQDLPKLMQMLSYYSRVAHSEWRDRYRYADDFGGTTLTDAPSLKDFKREVLKLKGEVCELMCHPGDAPDEDSVSFSKLKARQMEHDILVSLEFKSFLKETGIEIKSYKDIEDQQNG